MRNSFKDPALQAEFVENGYVVVRLHTTEDAERIRAAAVTCLPAAPQINDPQEALYLSVFDEDRRAPGSALTRAAATGPLEALLDDYYDAASHIIVKIPDSAALTMHQHQPVTSDIYEPVIHAWTTLDDVDDDSGALRIVPRSHAILRHVQSFNTAPFFAGFTRELEERYAVTVPMRAGETIMFERSLLHGSAANRTPRPSIRLLSTLIPAESALCVLTEHDDGFEALEVGEEQRHIDPELFCIAGGNPAGLKSAGRIDNRNMQISEAEFAALLRLGAKVRPGYDPIDQIRADARRNPPATTWRKLRDAGRALMRA